MRELRILLGESLVELFDFIQEDLQLVGRWQDGHSGQEGQRKGRHKLIQQMTQLRVLWTSENPRRTNLEILTRI